MTESWPLENVLMTSYYLSETGKNKTMNNQTVYDPLQKQHYRIINGVRYWQQPRPKEKYSKFTKILD